MGTRFLWGTLLVAALLAGNKIEAIRLQREQTGMGLAQAKAAVEGAEATLPHIIE